MSYNRNNNYNGGNRGGYGQNRNGNFRGNGNRNYGGGNGAGNDAGKYVESGVKKYISDDNGKQAVDLDEFLTEEFGFSLVRDKVEDLINKLRGAMETSEVGGAYVKIYLNRKQNRQTGEKFNGIRILVNKQDAPNERFQRGNFRGNAGGGRRDYGQSNQNNYQQNNYQNGNGGYNNGGQNMQNTPPSTGNYQAPANDPAPTGGSVGSNNYQQQANEPEF